MNQSRLRTALSLTAIALCLALAIPPARAMTNQQAGQLYVQVSSGKNPAALQSLQSAANNGDANAQFQLGFLYNSGQGVPQDDAQAAAWYLKAADHGDANAQFNLGVLYVQGQGVPQDYAQAASWYRKAADQGDAAAQTNLGLMYAEGQGVPQDDAQAASWWHKAADQGFAKAQTNLGAMYQFGQGVPQDYAIAYALFNLAAVSTMQASTNRDRISQQMSEADIESGQNLTRMMQNLGVTAAINAYANK